MRIVIILIAIISLSGFDFKKPESETDTIVWTNARKLRWEDFQGEPDLLSGGAAGTSVNIVIDYKLGDYLVAYNVRCIFYMKKSWTLDSCSESLKHEQVHFDIGEVFARKIRKQLSSQRFALKKGDGKNIDSIYRQNMAEYHQMQDEYDSTTMNGRKIYAQQKWNERIQLSIDSLHKYRK